MMIRIKDRIIEFEYYNNGKKVGESKTGKLITDTNFIDQTFPFRQIIGFYNKKGDYIEIDLLGNTESTTAKELYWNNFSDISLESLSSHFDFKLKAATHKTQGDKLIGYISNQGFDLDCKMAIKQHENIFYIVIFFIDLPDLYRGAGRFEGRLYVHDIGEVELSEEFKQRLFGENI